MKFLYFDKQSHDDYNEENRHTNQDHSHSRPVYYSIKHFYKRHDWIKLFVQCLTSIVLILTQICLFSMKRQKRVLPWTFKYVALTITGFPYDLNPQKYSPESDKSTCVILRKRVVVLDVILNLPFWNPSHKAALASGVIIEEMQLELDLSASLNQKMWAGRLEKLEQCSVTCWAGWTSTV